MTLETGLSHTSIIEVTPSLTATVVGSGDLPVLATPAMIALMENAAMLAVASLLPEGSTTVGGLINVSHLKPSAIKSTIKAIATVTKIEGKKLVFSVCAEDETGLIGEGSHIRYIVDRNKFMAKL
ncbi:MAG: thioesterase family protein [Bacteroidaceae bacterium]|nr:thioesterase family protein [Bacteroidaceae bacterium]